MREQGGSREQKSEGFSGLLKNQGARDGMGK